MLECTFWKINIRGRKNKVLQDTHIELNAKELFQTFPTNAEHILLS
jgi:hypothetical protein